MDTKLNMNQSYTLATKKANDILGCRSAARGQGRSAFPLVSTDEIHMEDWVQFQAPQYKRDKDIQSATKGSWW